MDINFHYFAVKTIAREAGFNEVDAQLIAEYSQFIDDYDVWQNYLVTKVPEYARPLATKLAPNLYSFYTVTTGFNSTFDLARLALAKYQREVVVPFHFIPYTKLSAISGKDRTQYRTIAADITDSSLISTMLRQAQETYRKDKNRYNLMRIGMLLHTFADTYAHQRFSGFHGWENYSYLTKVQDLAEHDKDITASYRPDSYASIYALGHAEVNHAPDDTFAYIEFSMAENEQQHAKDQYTLLYSRSNQQVFSEAAWQIFKYLSLCLDKSQPTPEAWERLKAKLKRGFDLHNKDISELAKGWCAICPDYDYHYAKEVLWKDQLIPLINTDPVFADLKALTTTQQAPKAMPTIYRTFTDDFFHFNLLAKEIRDTVINS